MLIKNLPSASVYVDCVGFSDVFPIRREMRDCCANQQCNVSVEKLRICFLLFN